MLAHLKIKEVIIVKEVVKVKEVITVKEMVSCYASPVAMFH